MIDTYYRFWYCFYTACFFPTTGIVANVAHNPLRATLIVSCRVIRPMLVYSSYNVSAFLALYLLSSVVSMIVVYDGVILL